jgi:hypothetical protein
VLAAGALALTLVGCSGSDPITESVIPIDDPSQSVNMTGAWNFVAPIGEVPETTDCSGDLAGQFYFLCTVFGAVVVDAGVGQFAGSSGSPTCGMTFTLQGTASGSTISGTLVVADASNIFEVAYTGSVDGHTATITPTTLELLGQNGVCTMRGHWDGSR